MSQGYDDITIIWNLNIMILLGKSIDGDFVVDLRSQPTASNILKVLRGHSLAMHW